MNDTFTRRHLLGLGAGAAAATAGAAVVGRNHREGSPGGGPDGADRLAAWTPASPAFLPEDREAPYGMVAADFQALERVERAIDGRLRAIPHRWLDRVAALVGLDRTAVDGYLQLAGRGLVQLLDWPHDLATVAGRLTGAGYERVGQRGEFAVYRQPTANSRELRAVPRLDDAVAVDGSRLLTCGAPRLDDPVTPLVAAIRAREGGPRLVERGDFETALLRSAPAADLLRVVPQLRPWMDDDEAETPALVGLQGYRRSVTFRDDRALVRSKLRYERGAVPDAAALRALFTGGASGPAVGVEQATSLQVTRNVATATVDAAAPLPAFAQ